MINYLTIDVEEYFQVSAFEKNCNVEEWEKFESRVTDNTEKVLGLLDKYKIKATFFIVGWIADRYPDLVKTISAKGHEIGCHSYYHRKVYDLSPLEFEEDTRKAKLSLEKIINKPVKAYRAPSYSVTKKSLWAFDILEKLGFTVDSSVFPIIHDVYGIPDAPRFQYKLPENEIMEFPMSTSLYFGRKIPVCGGGYFRLFPYWFTKKALKLINTKEEQPFVFYFHPWELDPDQPRFRNAGLLSRFRHYNNLHKTTPRLERLFSDFKFTSLPSTSF